MDTQPDSPQPNIPETPPQQQVKRELNIQPSQDLQQAVEARRQRMETEQTTATLPEPYPTSASETMLGNTGASRSAALAEMNARTEDVNRLVSMRVKSVMAIGIFLMLSSLYILGASIGKEGGTFLLIIGLIQLLIATGLLISKDQHTVALILKVLLIFQVLGFFMSLSDPISLAVNGVALLLLAYAYSNVKSLSYY